MEGMMSKLVAFRGTCTPSSIAAWQRLFRRNYTEDDSYSFNRVRKSHPYKKIHPWKSLNSFTDYLLKNVHYNKDGLVVLNKPYGISMSKQKIDSESSARKLVHKVPHEVHYTISDSLPKIAQELGHEKLIPVSNPERFMTGATLLATNERVEKDIRRSTRYAISINEFPKTYWIITTMTPKLLKGRQHLGMQLSYNGSTKQKKPVIIDKWSNNSEKREEVKILNVEFKLLSNSTQNLSSLIEIKSSTQKWHAIRLFAATKLYSPVLGDNYHGSRIQKIKDTYLVVNPFLPTTELLPVLNKDLLTLLQITPSRQEIIPAHVHLRSIYLPSLFGKNKDFKVEVPLLPPFDWTIEQLKFKLPASRESEQSTEDLQVAAAC